MSEVTKIIDTAHHRNGVGGRGFSVVKFIDADEQRTMLAVVFDEREQDNRESVTAVFDLNLLAEGVIAFGENSWRGDQYDEALRRELARRWPNAPCDVEHGIPPGAPDSAIRLANLEAAYVLLGPEVACG
jgi:hypothetical protein